LFDIVFIFGCHFNYTFSPACNQINNYFLGILYGCFKKLSTFDYSNINPILLVCYESFDIAYMVQIHSNAWKFKCRNCNSV